MIRLPFLALCAFAATPAISEDARHLDAHEHGVGQLDIAFDGQQIAMELHAPGADIVGFEYAAESDKDHAAIENAVAMLAQPMNLFVLPDAAGCQVVKAEAEIEGDDEHDKHEHDEHAEKHEGEGHDGHDEDHDAHDEGHDGHDEDHDSHEDHEGHKNEAGHTEFHATYLLNCTDPTAVSNISFTYFEMFENALEVEVQVISATGATSFEVERDAPNLDLRSIF
jgi:hypothetical protein